MRLLSVINKSHQYIKSLYTNNPELEKQSYDIQYQSWADDTFGGSEIWTTGLLDHGYESTRVYANIPQIQQQWAREKGIQYDQNHWEEAIAWAQIKAYKPDILFVSNYTTFSAQTLECIQEDVPSIQLVVGWCGSPYRDPTIFREFDFILSNVPELIEDFLKNGYPCYHLNHAFDPRVLEKIDTRIATNVNFSFIGSVIKNTGFHYGREALLIDLINNTDLQIWSNVNRLTRKRKIKKIGQQLAYYIANLLISIGFNKNFLANIPRFESCTNMEERQDYSSYVDSRIAKRALPPLYGISMYEKLRGSKITLNSHGEISPKYASNMRLYEGTGVGTCLLTDWKINLKDLYKSELEVATYRSAEECIEKVLYLLGNERERMAIAEAGQKRTLAEHTIYHRAEQLDEIIQSHLKKSN